MSVDNAANTKENLVNNDVCINRARLSKLGYNADRPNIDCQPHLVVKGQEYSLATMFIGEIETRDGKEFAKHAVLYHQLAGGLIAGIEYKDGIYLEDICKVPLPGVLVSMAS